MATYKGVEPSAPLIQWFWEVMESFSNTERSLFLRFVWGRTRLPRTIADFRGRDFVIQVWLLHVLWEQLRVMPLAQSSAADEKTDSSFLLHGVPTLWKQNEKHLTSLI